MLFIFSGCDDDSDKFGSSSSVICTDWGASKSEVMDYMKNFKKSVDENDFICYIGKNSVQTVSYQFQNEGLQASLMIYSQDEISLSQLQLIFKNYDYLGELDGLHIYVSEAKNTMVTIAERKEGENEYYAVGYTDLESKE